VRLAYLFVSFSFGETYATAGVLLGLVLTPVVVYGLWRSAALRPVWLPMVLVATGIAWAGVTRWSEFPFMPTGLMFTFPFFLILVARNMHSVGFAAMILMYASADYAYFSRSGFLIKPYAAPYREMAATIREGSQGRDIVLAVDGSFYEPLFGKLGKNVEVVALDDPGARETIRTASNPAQPGGSRPAAIWLLRHTRGSSSGEFISKLEIDLSTGHEIRNYDFLPYSRAERWIRRVLRGPRQAEYYYRLSLVAN
jgi:hypothetical protein